MNHVEGCDGFRRKLARALEGAPMPEELTTLSWHEHLLGCEDCRELLQREEALEVLLATLPEPKLPPDLTRRLVARLSNSTEASLDFGLDQLLEADGVAIPVGLSSRVRDGLRAEAALDELLELDGHLEVPGGLAARVAEGARQEAALDELLERGDHVVVPADLSAQVLAGIHAEAKLDALLELDLEVELPVGLSSRVLSALDSQRARSIPRLRLLRTMPRYAAAAGLLLVALGVSLWDGGLVEDPISTTQPGTEEVAVVDVEGAQAPAANEPDPSLLAMLDILENDGLWLDTEDGVEAVIEELDPHLLLSDSLETSDEVLLTFYGENESETDLPSDG